MIKFKPFYFFIFITLRLNLKTSNYKRGSLTRSQLSLENRYLIKFVIFLSKNLFEKDDIPNNLKELWKNFFSHQTSQFLLFNWGLWPWGLGGLKGSASLPQLPLKFNFNSISCKYIWPFHNVWFVNRNFL